MPKELPNKRVRPSPDVNPKGAAESTAKKLVNVTYEKTMAFQEESLHILFYQVMSAR